jgi:hypothetical protein
MRTPPGSPTRIRNFCAAAAATTALLLSPAAFAEPVGYLAGVEGTVEVGPGGTSWEAGATDLALEQGDWLRTGLGSKAKVILNDDTVLSLGEETEVAVETLVAGSTVASGGEPTTLRMLRGKMRTRVGRGFGDDTKLEVHTPTAVVGVKGTDFETHIVSSAGGPGRPADSTQACTWDGNIFVRSSDPNLLKTIRNVGPGFCSFVRDGFRPDELEVMPSDFESVGSGPSSGASATSSPGLVAYVVATPDVGSEGQEFDPLSEGDESPYDSAQALRISGGLPDVRDLPPPTVTPSSIEPSIFVAPDGGTSRSDPFPGTDIPRLVNPDPLPHELP